MSSPDRRCTSLGWSPSELSTEAQSLRACTPVSPALLKLCSFFYVWVFGANMLSVESFGRGYRDGTCSLSKTKSPMGASLVLGSWYDSKSNTMAKGNVTFCFRGSRQRTGVGFSCSYLTTRLYSAWTITSFLRNVLWYTSSLVTFFPFSWCNTCSLSGWHVGQP